MRLKFDDWDFLRDYQIKYFYFIKQKIFWQIEDSVSR